MAGFLNMILYNMSNSNSEFRQGQKFLPTSRSGQCKILTLQCEHISIRTFADSKCPERVEVVKFVKLINTSVEVKTFFRDWKNLPQHDVSKKLLSKLGCGYYFIVCANTHFSQTRSAVVYMSRPAFSLLVINGHERRIRCHSVVVQQQISWSL